MKKNPGYKNKQRLKLNLFSLRSIFEEKNTPTYYRPCLKLLRSFRETEKETVFRIRIQLSVWNQIRNGNPEVKEFHVLKCWMFVSCSLKALHRGLRIKTMAFLIRIFFCFPGSWSGSGFPKKTRIWSRFSESRFENWNESTIINPPLSPIASTARMSDAKNEDFFFFKGTVSRPLNSREAMFFYKYNS